MTDFPQPLRLAVGSHQAGSGKGCGMNVISWENGDQKITDFPKCSDRLLARVVQMVNDSYCTHAEDGLLCSPCSVRVLTLAHRTTGTGATFMRPAHPRLRRAGSMADRNRCPAVRPR